MKLLGHLPDFLDSISMLRNQAAQPNYHHSSNMLLNLFIHDHIHALRYALLVIAVIVVVTWVRKQKCLNKLYESKFYLPAMCLGCIVIVIILAMYLEHELRYRWALPGFCYAVLMLGLISESRRGSRSHALLYFIALILLVIVPLGSNNGIGNAIYGSWLALPLALLVLRRTSIYRSTIYTESASQTEVKLLYQNKESEFLANNLKTKPWHLGWLPVAGFSKVIAGAILLFSGHLAYVSTYRDSADRSALQYGIADSKLKGILTTKARSQVVEELLVELNKIVKPGDKLLAITDIPMLNYLTHTRPFLSSPWTRLIPQEQLISELRNIRKNIPSLPIVVRSKGSVDETEWPSAKISSKYMGGGELLIRAFMEDYNYEKKWENQWFEIWVVIK